LHRAACSGVSPVAVVRRGVEAPICPERIELLAAGQEKADGAHVAIPGAPRNQRHIVVVLRGRCVSAGNVLKDKIGPAAGNAIECHIFAFEHFLTPPL